jgi:hypothetical protein
MSRIEPEYQDVYTTWAAQPTPETTGKLLTAIDPIINNALSAYGGKSKTSPTLRSKARSLAVNAFPTYDPKKGPLRSHLLSQLQRLRRVAGQEQQVVRMPERVSMQRRQLEEAGLHLEDQLGRPPSDLELSDYIGVSPKRMAHIRKGIKPVLESQITSVAGDQGYAPSVAQSGEDSWMEFVHSSLSPRDQIIMERTLAMHGHRQHSPTQVAKHLGVSPAAVSQRMANIQKQIDSREDLGVL